MAKTPWQRLTDLFRSDTPKQVVDERPFIIFADQVGTMNKASAEAIDMMCKSFAEQGVRVHVVCQSEETSALLEETYEYWQEGGDLRRHSLGSGINEIWHVRGEAGAENFLKDHGAELSGFVKIQDVPNSKYLANTIRVHPGQLAEESTFLKVKSHIDRATGARSNDSPVYRFIGPKVDAKQRDPYLLGGKGANLSYYANQGINVPAGFTISTDVCRDYMRDGHLPENLVADHITPAMKDLATYEGAAFGDPSNPLLVSVRSGAPESMPGMMDTVINVGMTKDIADFQAKKWANNPAMVLYTYKTYGDFVKSYSKAVIGPTLPAEKQQALGKVLHRMESELKFYKEDPSAIDVEEMSEVFDELANDIKAATGQAIPQNAVEQRSKAIEAVMQSWNSDRAKAYRHENHISDDLGTAVTIQAMKPGDHPYKSGAGVLFSRDVTTGEPRLSGNFLPGGQGEEVVSGSSGKVPHLDELRKLSAAHYDELRAIAIAIEHQEGRVQEIEFCVSQDKLYILQTRHAKCTPEAEVRIALDMAKAEIANAKNSLIEQDIDERAIYQDMLEKFETLDTGKLLGTRIKPEALQQSRIETRGDAVCTSAASGVAVFNDKDLQRVKASGRNAIFISSGSLTDDYETVNSAAGTLVIGGNPSSHAAVVARSMGKAYVCGIEGQLDGSSLTLPNGNVIHAGEKVTLGENGEVVLGELPLEQKPISPTVQEVIQLDEQYGKGTLRRAVEDNRRLSAAEFEAQEVTPKPARDDVSIAR